MFERQGPGRARNSLFRQARALVGRFRQETHAGPIVEFAIIVPVLLLMLLGIIDIGFAFFRMNSLVAAAREGARFASVQAEPCLTNPQTATKNRVMSYFNPGVGAVADQLVAAGITVTALDAAQAAVTTAGCPAVTTIRVQIPAYNYRPINPAFRLINATGAFTFRPVIAQFRWERAP